MKRRLVNLLAALSLLLCVATVVMWVRSYCAWDRWALPRSEGGSYTRVETWRGKLEVGFIPRRGVVSWDHYHAWVNWHGFHFGFTLLNIWEMDPEHGGAPPMAFDGPACDAYIIAVPFWFIFAAFALIPVAHLLWRHRKNVTPGSCVCCGYDLRATPERCPECGTIPAQAHSGSGDQQTAPPAGRSA